MRRSLTWPPSATRSLPPSLQPVKVKINHNDKGETRIENDAHQWLRHHDELPSVTKLLPLLLLRAGGAGGANVSPSVTSSLYLQSGSCKLRIAKH